MSIVTIPVGVDPGAPALLGARIRELRLAQVPPVSQLELATRAGLSESLIKKLEEGARDVGRVGTLRLLAAALGVDAPALLAPAGTPVGQTRAVGAVERSAGRSEPLPGHEGDLVDRPAGRRPGGGATADGVSTEDGEDRVGTDDGRRTRLAVLLAEWPMTRYEAIMRFNATARALEEDVTVSLRQFDRWANGRGSMPRPAASRVLEAAFGLPVADLLSAHSDPPRPYATHDDPGKDEAERDAKGGPTHGGTVLRALLRERHWQNYATFCKQYDQVAAQIDSDLIGTSPSRPQLQRWLSGTMKGIPYPDHCRILEAMFPGHTVRRLFETPALRSQAQSEALVHQLPPEMLGGSDHELPAEEALAQYSDGIAREASNVSRSTMLGGTIAGIALPAISVDDVRHLVSSDSILNEVLVNLREQWHSLVKTDNLLGPRFALTGVLAQIETIEVILPALRETARVEAVQLAAQYAESAAWLYEDSGYMIPARHWTGRAMEWAYEAGDESMVAWTVFRRSQQAGAARDAAQVIGLTRAARRNEGQLATPMRAAIRVQEAYGLALDGDESTSQQLLDEAHIWAASDTVGDARGGHGSYCTASHIEIQRALCLSTMGQHRRAIGLFQEGIRGLPSAFNRNRASAQSQLAAAYVADGQIEEGAAVAHAALAVARGTGAGRTIKEIKDLSVKLAPHWKVSTVTALLDDLRVRASGDAS